MQICTGIIDTFDTFLQNVKFHMPYIIFLYLFDTYLTLSTNKKIESVKSVKSAVQKINMNPTDDLYAFVEKKREIICIFLHKNLHIRIICSIFAGWKYK